MKSLEIVRDKLYILEKYPAKIETVKLEKDVLINQEQLLKIEQDLERLQKQDEDVKSGDLSDGYHTFNDLYYQRCILFATLVNQNKKTSWKSYKHENGELCFGGGWFIVGIDTPLGSYTYHYENKYWDLFQCKELEKGKEWDGHTSKDVARLLSIENEDLEVLEIIRKKKVDLSYLLFYLKVSANDKIALSRYNGQDRFKLSMEELLKLKQWLEVNE